VTQSPGGGFFQAIPFRVPVGMDADQVVVGLTPWGTPSLAAIGGAATGRPDDRLMLLTYEWPMPWFEPMSPLGNAELERMHLDRFVTELLDHDGRTR